MAEQVIVPLRKNMHNKDSYVHIPCHCILHCVYVCRHPVTVYYTVYMYINILSLYMYICIDILSLYITNCVDCVDNACVEL